MAYPGHMAARRTTRNGTIRIGGGVAKRACQQINGGSGEEGWALSWRAIRYGIISAQWP